MSRVSPFPVKPLLVQTVLDSVSHREVFPYFGKSKIQANHLEQADSSLLPLFGKKGREVVHAC